MSIIKLSEAPYYRKLQLASVIGYTIEKIGYSRYKLLNVPDCFNNEFSSVDEVLLLNVPELKRKGFLVVA